MSCGHPTPQAAWHRLSSPPPPRRRRADSVPTPSGDESATGDDSLSEGLHLCPGATPLAGWWSPEATPAETKCGRVSCGHPTPQAAWHRPDGGSGLSSKEVQKVEASKRWPRGAGTPRPGIRGPSCPILETADGPRNASPPGWITASPAAR
ncbi:hypothetical protein HNQ78_001838 [Phycisphaera mikurensis]|nr:hypothetical protein [Phycisphaera mikurensis]